MKISFKLIDVDSEKRVAVYLNGKWIEDIDINSQFSVREAHDYAIDKYLKKETIFSL